MRFASPASTFLKGQPQDIRSKLRAICKQLAENPYPSPDDPSKRLFLMAPAIATLWQNAEHWILYHLDQQGIVFVNIGTIDEKPSPWRNS